MKQKVSSLATVITLVTFLLAPFVTATPISAEDASSSSQTTQNLKERIEKLVEEKREQIKGVLSELGTEKKGFIGGVQRVSEEAITLKTLKDTRVIPLTTDTTLMKGTKKVTAQDIAVGDWIVVLGSIKDDAFVPVRILISSEPLRPKPQVVVLGTITKTSKTSASVAPRLGGDEVVFTLDKNSTYQDVNGEAAKQTDLKADLQVLAIGTRDNETIKANTIRILSNIQAADEP